MKLKIMKKMNDKYELYQIGYEKVTMEEAAIHMLLMSEENPEKKWKNTTTPHDFSQLIEKYGEENCVIFGKLANGEPYINIFE